MIKSKIKVLLCDLGGVLLTNGWGRDSRVKAANHFGFDFDEMQSRHQLIFGNYEVGKITLTEYLHYAVFFKPRTFTQEAFIEFIYAQSQPHPEMLAWIKDLKKKYQLKVVILSNEGQELTDYRIKTFKLDELGDFFLVSCYMGISKPDLEVYRKAIEFVQTPPEQIVYLDDRQLFIDIANEFHINAICHKEIQSTQKALKELGLS